MSNDIPVELADLRSVSLFSDWVVWADGGDEFGNFIGYCPLHDQARAKEASAEFNFRKGVMYCVNGPTGDCHPGKKAMSLTNVHASMMSRGSQQ